MISPTYSFSTVGASGGSSEGLYLASVSTNCLAEARVETQMQMSLTEQGDYLGDFP